MNVKRERKITFTNVGIAQGSRVWRNSETGVEIIKGKHFGKVGLYYVCIPAQTKEGRVAHGAERTLAKARDLATVMVRIKRDGIAAAYAAACLEDSDIDAVRAASVRDVVKNRGELGEILGPIPGGLLVRDLYGREHITLTNSPDVPLAADKVTFTSGVVRQRADIDRWIVLANFRGDV